MFCIFKRDFPKIVKISLLQSQNLVPAKYGEKSPIRKNKLLQKASATRYQFKKVLEADILIHFSFRNLQFEEVAKIIDSREDLGTVILRNTSADDSVLETLAPSLINAPTLKVSSKRLA